MTLVAGKKRAKLSRISHFHDRIERASARAQAREDMDDVGWSDRPNSVGKLHDKRWNKNPLRQPEVEENDVSKRDEGIEEIVNK
ncbi:hypothetical protein GWI33_009118 [Rhynchophorus ferrugineus]|uniref:Uncharacterized protein n=1 Tax=Rhynchophorus ferrugineus TaxID=354439 RepID=A0A834IDU2_RHYFE|nr:hypothetical protein GWI33_009118 [Rhynchophorus ferrugineus]